MVTTFGPIEFETAGKKPYTANDFILAVEDYQLSLEMDVRQFTRKLDILPVDYEALLLSTDPQPDLSFYQTIIAHCPKLIPECLAAMTGDKKYLSYLYI
jgi:hypothetical protein